MSKCFAFICISQSISFHDVSEQPNLCCTLERIFNMSGSGTCPQHTASLWGQERIRRWYVLSEPVLEEGEITVDLLRRLLRRDGTLKDKWASYSGEEGERNPADKNSGLGESGWRQEQGQAEMARVACLLMELQRNKVAGGWSQVGKSLKAN